MWLSKSSRRWAATLPAVAATLLLVPLAGMSGGCGNDKAEEAAERQGNETKEERIEDANKRAPAGQTGQVVGDPITTGKIKTALIADHAVEASDINVDTAEGGVVTLTGTQKSQAAIDAAAADAKKVEGVKSVVNNLTVKKGD